MRAFLDFNDVKPFLAVLSRMPADTKLEVKAEDGRVSMVAKAIDNDTGGFVLARTVTRATVEEEGEFTVFVDKKLSSAFETFPGEVEVTDVRGNPEFRFKAYSTNPVLMFREATPLFGASPQLPARAGVELLINSTDLKKKVIRPLNVRKGDRVKITTSKDFTVFENPERGTVNIINKNSTAVLGYFHVEDAVAGTPGILYKTVYGIPKGVTRLKIWKDYVGVVFRNLSLIAGLR